MLSLSFLFTYLSLSQILNILSHINNLLTVSELLQVTMFNNYLSIRRILLFLVVVQLLVLLFFLIPDGSLSNGFKV